MIKLKIILRSKNVFFNNINYNNKNKQTNLTNKN